MYDVELELVRLVRDPAIIADVGRPPAFHGPVINGFSPAKTIADAAVLQRLCYNQARQDMPYLSSTNFVPYLYWTGPLNYDKGQVSVGSSGTKKADFWFWCCHKSLTDSMKWVNEIEIAVERMTFPYVMGTVRLTAAILIDKVPVLDDQTQKTAQEYPVSRATIGFTFGYQSVSG